MITGILSYSSSPQIGRRHWSLMKRPRNVSPSQPNLPYLAALVKAHFERIVDTLCQHFNDRDTDFCQQVWLCYERLFFEAFGSEFLPLYQVRRHSSHTLKDPHTPHPHTLTPTLPPQAHYAKFCEQLQLNCVSVSILDPRGLNLGVPDETLLNVFKRRSFEEASRLYQELTDEGYLAGTKALEQDPEFRALFGGVASDLTSLPLAISPLERLQLLTSAFRKVMATLSELKMRSLLQRRRFQGGRGDREGRVLLFVCLLPSACKIFLPSFDSIFYRTSRPLPSPLCSHYSSSHPPSFFLSSFLSPSLLSSPPLSFPLPPSPFLSLSLPHTSSPSLPLSPFLSLPSPSSSSLSLLLPYSLSLPLPPSPSLPSSPSLSFLSLPLPSSPSLSLPPPSSHAPPSAEDSIDLSHAGVSCDDLLPLLTLILLQMHPSFLANLHLHCCFLEDYIAQFLSAGWHGYSLAAFRSVLQIIAEL